MQESAKYIKEQIALYKPMKEEYLKHIEVLDKYIQQINEIICKHDESDIDSMKELGIDFHRHIAVMKQIIAKMNIFAEITQLKYKEALRKEIDDKFDCMDKAKLMYNTIFGEIDMWRDILEWSGRHYSTLQGEVKQLLGDKRAAEYMNI